ncbi:hypothetical protein ACH4TY_32980 [Streptomyces anulatus]
MTRSAKRNGRSGTGGKAPSGPGGEAPSGTEGRAGRDEPMAPGRASRKLRRRDYDKAERALQIELLKLQHWVKERDERLVILSRNEQRNRFMIRQIDPVRRWKLSPVDLASLDKWDEYTEAKELMLFHTDTADAPWTVVKSNGKKRARLEAMRHVLDRFDYPGKDPETVGKPDPLIVGPASRLFEGVEMDARLLGPVTSTSRTTDF